MNRTVVIYFVVAFAIAFLSFRAIWFSFIMPIYEPVFGLGEEVGSIFNSGDFAGRQAPDIQCFACDNHIFLSSSVEVSDG